jgi:hypothetical protein
MKRALAPCVALALLGVALAPACSASSAPASGADSGPTMAAKDATQTIDTVMPPRDANPYAYNEAAPPCQPASPAAFSPTAVSPVRNPICTEAQIAGLVTACFDPLLATDAACATWRAVAANENCLEDCPVISAFAASPALHNPPPPPEGPWGPLVEVESQSGIVLLNYGGCVAAADPSSAAQSCAAALNAELECEYYVCAANCPIPFDADAAVESAAQEAYNDCMLSADSGPCRAYASAAEACTAALPATSPATFCVDGSLASNNSASFDPAWEKFIGNQCGGKPGQDGGEPDAIAHDAAPD